MNIVSFGGGTNSTAMIIGMYLHKIPIDLILFADPGSEHPHTYDFLKTFEAWLQARGLPKITPVYTTDKNGDRLYLYQECIDRKALPSIAYGFKKCSDKYKIRPQERLLSAHPQAKEIWAAGGKLQKWIGYDAGETKRLQCSMAYDEKDEKYHRHFPLYEWGWDRAECRRVIERAGLPLPGKSSCFFCPSMKKKEIISLYEAHPDLFAMAVRMEQNADLTSLKGLGRDWSWSDMISAYCHNKEFDEAQMSLFADAVQSCGCIDPCGCYDG